MNIKIISQQLRISLLILLAIGFVTLAQAQKIGWKKGWDQERVLAYEKGQRPDPSIYLKKGYIKKHLKAFESQAGGSSYFVTQGSLEKYGCDPAGRSDGQFVLPYRSADVLLKITGGDVAKIEESLGVPAGAWGPPEVLLLLVISDPGALNVRMPSGNESGANEFWIPGGYTSGGEMEAVLDPVPKTSYQAILVDPCPGK